MFFSNLFPTLYDLLREELTDSFNTEASFTLSMDEGFDVQICMNARLSSFRLVSNNLLGSIRITKIKILSAKQT